MCPLSLMAFTHIAYPGLLPFLLGLFAAALAWQFNKALGRLPVRKLILLTPLVEEAAKTLLAVYFAANIFFTHFFFGAVEGSWEMFSVRRNGFYAGLSALASHSVFGAITVLVHELYGALLPALAAGYLVHAAWNYAVLEYFPARKSGAGR